MKQIKAPHIYKNQEKPYFFLAGSIEMGTASNWQDIVISSLRDCKGTLLNPRRTHWDSSWEQVESNTMFSEQVNWELDGIVDHRVIVCFYFDPNTKSPITMLELGIALALGKECVVCCPDGFWRKGNVVITCKRFNVEVLHSLPELINHIKKRSNK